MTETSLHCQICARPVRAASGVIAHHGYRRPGQGWQTASCFGARHRPYEVGHDALDLWIARLETWIPEKEAALAAHRASPPDRYDVRRVDAYGSRVGREPVWAERPTDFHPDPAAGPDHRARRPGAYEAHFWRQATALRETIRDMTAALAEARARRQAWRAPQ